MRFFLSLLSFLLLSPFSATYAQSFEDTSGYPWQYSVEYLSEEGIVKGYEDGTFRPDALINRAELTKILIESVFYADDIAASADDCFPDVNASDWFSPYVCLAKAEGIVSGHADGYFRPSDTITQAAALKIILETFFYDIPAVQGNWYDKYFAEAEYLGMLYFSEEDPAPHFLTRGEMAYFVTWLLDETSPDQIAYETFYNDVEFGDWDFWEPLTAEDCYADEYFDPVDQMCYLSVSGIDDGDVESFESQYSDFFGQLIDSAYDYDAQSEILEDGPEAFVRYTISENAVTFAEAVALPAPTDQELLQHQQLWEYFDGLVPRSHRQDLFYEFHIFSDGKDGIMAYVFQNEDDPSEWVLAVDPADAYLENGEIDSGEFSITLVHEFAHVLTLGLDQIDPVYLADDSEAAYRKAEESCRPRFFIEEGCAKTDSFLNVFFKRFWGGTLSEEWESLQVNGQASEDDLYAFYERHQESFVTDYAATNVVEDIAESFAYYVFKEPSASQTLSDQKLQFFSEYPGFVTLRKAIRQNLSSSL